MSYFDFLRELLLYLGFYLRQFVDPRFSLFQNPVIEIFISVVIFFTVINFIIRHLSAYSPVIKEVYEERKEEIKKGG